MNSTTTLRKLLLVGLTLATISVGFAGSAEAHPCESYGGHYGCDSHYCPNDGVYHKHWHDCAWYESCFNHGCTSG